MENQLIDRRLPENQGVFDVPFPSSRTPSVPNPVDHGKLSLGVKPKHKTEMDLALCNTLPPAPRSQLVNYPPENTMCPDDNPLPYLKDTCYLVNNTAQGVVGLVCNGPGQSGNANFYRGNQFSNGYEWINQYAYEGEKKLEYTDEFPVQSSYQLSNPTLIYKKPYTYPSGEFIRRQDPRYRTYPQFSNYTANGFPIYTYPYKDLNTKSADLVETFADLPNKILNNNTVIMSVLVALILVLFVYYVRKH
jgi:hypothetical protein